MSWPMTAMSLVASDAEELCGSVTDPAPSGLPAPSAAKAGMDAELFRVLSNAVLKSWVWSGLHQRSPLAAVWMSGFCRGRRQAPQQRPSPFFPEVHDELTRSWRSPYSCPPPYFRLHLPSLRLMAAEEKGYERMPQLDESVAATSLPTHTAIGWKAKASHPSKPCRDHFSARWTLLRFSWTGGFGAPLYGGLQVYQAKLLSAIDESEPDPATLRELRRRNRPSFASHQDYRPSHRKVYGQAW